MCNLFQILFHYRLLQDTEYEFLVAAQQDLDAHLFCIQCSVNPKPLVSPSYPIPFGNSKFVFCVCEFVSVL